MTAAARPLTSESERLVPHPMLRLKRSPREGCRPEFGAGIFSVVEGSIGEKEEKGILRFIQEALGYFSELFEAGVEMDLVKVVGKPGELDETRFRVHVSPSKAATGLRYSNLMGELLVWARKSASKDPEGGFMSYYSVVVYVETLVQKGAGFYTLISLLYAVDFFAKAFEFDIDAKAWSRSKRLALRYKGQKGERRPAKSFSGETLRALEKMVKDDMLKKPLRVASGKLRLCVQASIRHDALLNTPISALEWTRRKGGLGIVALRSRALRGKNKARLWIGSIKRWVARLPPQAPA